MHTVDEALAAERRATVERILRNLEGWYEYRPTGGTDREQQAWVNGWNEARQSIIEEAQRLGILTPADRAYLTRVDEEAEKERTTASIPSATFAVVSLSRRR